MAILGINVSELLANDVGDTLTVVDVAQPSGGGTLTFDGTTIRYTAPETGDGDQFQYTVQDRFGQRSTATVHISIVSGQVQVLAVDDVVSAVLSISTEIQVLTGNAVIQTNTTLTSSGFIPGEIISIFGEGVITTTSTATYADIYTAINANAALQAKGISAIYLTVGDDFNLVIANSMVAGKEYKIALIRPTANFTLNEARANVDTRFNNEWQIVDVPVAGRAAPIFIQGPTLLANDLGNGIDVQSVAAIPGVTKGTVSYSGTTKRVTYQPPYTSSPITSDQFSYTITDGTQTSTAKVTMNLSQGVKANPDTFILPFRKTYYTLTGSVRLTGHSDFSALGYTGTGQINVLGLVINYDVTQLRQDMELILGPINNRNAVPGVTAKVVTVAGVEVEDTHDFGYLKLYRESGPFTDAEIASLPPLLFGSTNFGQEDIAAPYTITFEELLANDQGTGIRVKSFNEPQFGSLVALTSDDGVTQVALRYEGRRDFIPPNGDTFQYTIVDSGGQQSTTTVTVIENTRPE